MKKIIVCMLVFYMSVSLVGCSNSSSINERKSGYTEAAIETDETKERIGNTVPDWVMSTKNSEPLYVLTEQTDDFDRFAVSEFPDYCYPGWTQEQSDNVYLGKGIRLFQLDNENIENIIVAYPVILDGHIILLFMVYRNINSAELHCQMGPLAVNELNSFFGKTAERNPLILGYNCNNLIALQGDNYYLLVKDFMENNSINETVIPSISINDNLTVNVLEPLCTERNAKVDDWTLIQPDVD